MKSKARWYVYRLVDPRDGAAFYVGKGCDSRIHQHEKDAANPKTAFSRKINKIRDIQACGREIGKQFDAFFWDEQAAYDHETDLIEEIGLASLTNVLPGGQKAWERRRQERASRRVDPLHMFLAKSGAKELFARMAEWLKIGGHKGAKVKLSTSNPAFALTCQVSEVVYNEMMPMLWKQITADAQALDVTRAGLRRFGVELA